MPAKKSHRRKAQRTASRRKPGSSPLFKVLAAVAILIAVVAGTVVVMRLMAPREPVPKFTERGQKLPRAETPAVNSTKPEKAADTKAPAPKAPARNGEVEKPLHSAEPLHEVFPKKPSAPQPMSPESGSLQASLPPSPPELPPLKKAPKVAIIIDDLGYDRHIAEKLMNLDAPLTLAILPHSPHTQAISRKAQIHGLEIMLHLPMEPVEYPEINPGPGALLTSMGPEELLQVLEENLVAVPNVKGVNNHMGSKLTTQSEQIYQIFSLLKRRGLFFVDSRTTEESICRPSARLIQIPFAQRDVFLDHFHDPIFIRKQFRELVRIARLKGEAVGIAHPNAMTYTILKETLPALRQQVNLVPASHLVRMVD
jgi:polysaccharide deacetylase 2 family uncharacterized protein YibQ